MMTSYARISIGTDLIVDDDTVRGKIARLIDDNPGIHFRGICKATEKEVGVVQYHLRVLEKFKMITRQRDGRYTRFFNVTWKNQMAKKLVSALNRDVEKDILHDVSVGEFRVKKTADDLKLTSQAVTWHVTRLVGEGILENIGGKIGFSTIARQEFDATMKKLNEES